MLLLPRDAAAATSAYTGGTLLGSIFAVGWRGMAAETSVAGPVAAGVCYSLAIGCCAVGRGV